MSDTQTLLLVLMVIYGWECGHWVRRGAVAWLQYWGPRWRGRHPGALLANQNGGVIFSQPLPPLGTITITRQFPLSLSPEAVLAFVSFSINPDGRPAQSGRCWRWEDIHQITADFKKVRINGELLLSLSSPLYAQYLAAQLETMRKLPMEKRADAIRRIYQTGFDTEQISQRWQEFEKQARAVRVLANVLFFYSFAAVPAIIWRAGLSATWPWLALGLLGLTFSTALVFHRRHRVLYPAADDERFTHFIVIMLSPASAIRAHDVLSRPLLEAFHPLAVAKSLGGAEAFSALARNYWRDVKHPARPLCPNADAPAAATEQFARELFQHELAGFLRRQKIDLTELARAPKPADASCRAYCPRCEAQFTKENGECADCGGIPLVAYAPVENK